MRFPDFQSAHEGGKVTFNKQRLYLKSQNEEKNIIMDSEIFSVVGFACTCIRGTLRAMRCAKSQRMHLKNMDRYCNWNTCLHFVKQCASQLRESHLLKSAKCY